jgi:prepilin-type processing-associated H-X9-DG protein
MGGKTSYGVKGNILVCPSRNSEIYGPTTFNTNYAYNTRCGNEIDMQSSPSYGYVKLSKVHYPTHGLLITDHRNVTFNAIKWDQALFSANQIDRRHSSGANYLFIDGHVKWEQDIVDTTPCDMSGYYWARWANSPGQ